MTTSDDKPQPPEPSAADDHEVGYGRPPRHSRFAPGRSGNPRGRPRTDSLTGGAFARVMGRKIVVREGARKKRMTIVESLLTDLAQRALKGDRAAQREVVRLLVASGVNAVDRPASPSQPSGIIFNAVFPADAPDGGS